jgi:hypothetical protein
MFDSIAAAWRCGAPDSVYTFSIAPILRRLDAYRSISYRFLTGGTEKKIDSGQSRGLRCACCLSQPPEVFNMKARLLIAATSALLASSITHAQVSAGPNCVTGTLASYIALGSGGCMFESTLYRDFTYIAPVPTTITPEQILVIPSSIASVTTPNPGLTFYAPWNVGADRELTSTIGYNTVPFPPNASAEVFATELTLDLGTSSIGGPIGSVEVTETASRASVAAPDTLQVFETCEEVCALKKTDTASLAGLETLTFSLTVTLNGGDGGASLNYFTANESYGPLP